MRQHDLEPGREQDMTAAERRRTDVVGVFPGTDSIIRLAGAVPAAQKHEWTEGHRTMGPESLPRAASP
jgi:transposase-like protein